MTSECISSRNKKNGKLFTLYKKNGKLFTLFVMLPVSWIQTLTGRGSRLLGLGRCYGCGSTSQSEPRVGCALTNERPSYNQSRVVHWLPGLAQVRAAPGASAVFIPGWHMTQSTWLTLTLIIWCHGIMMWGVGIITWKYIHNYWNKMPHLFL